MTTTTVPLWTSLPPHVLATVADSLPIVRDLLSFTAACRAFRTAVGPEQYATVLHSQYRNLCSAIPLLSYALSSIVHATTFKWRRRDDRQQGPAFFPGVRPDPAVDDPELGASAFFFAIYDRLKAADPLWVPSSINGSCCLEQALRYGLLPLAKWMVVDGGAELHHSVDAILCAVASNKLAVTKFAVESKLDKNFYLANSEPEDIDNWGALNEALALENFEIVDYLVQAVREKKLGRYVLGIDSESLLDAVEANDRAMLFKLIDFGCPLGEAVFTVGESLDFELAQEFHARGVDLRPAFVAAVSELSADDTRSHDFVEMLREWGQATHSLDNWHEEWIQLALDKALQRGNSAGVDYALSHGGDFEAIGPSAAIFQFVISRRRKQADLVLQWLKEHPNFSLDLSDHPKASYEACNAEDLWNELSRMYSDEE
ncbi:hypothetical protein HKX48_002929 [Thoreauomyces humboldtii]|nr:hypothetical protein HKX48_002929 [Thoreauomyces humboldtii]